MKSRFSGVAGVALLSALATLAAFAANGQNPSENAQTTTLSGTTSVLSVARPDDQVVVNGRVLKVSEVMAMISAGDSLREQRLHIPVTQIRGELKPNEQRQPASQSCQGETGSAPNHACAATGSAAQDLGTKRQQK